MTEMTTRAAGRGFWDRPATWKAVALVVGYLAFYVVVGRLLRAVFADQIDEDNFISSATSTFYALVLPTMVGFLALLVFTWRIGWLPAVFGPQPIRGRGWMWLAPVLILATVVGHLGATDWSRWTAGQIAMLGLLGLFIGLVEEVATRGLAVKVLRDAGHSERVVMVVSSLLFGLMHMTNVLAGVPLRTVLVTVVYAVFFGICMYLTMRVAGTIWAAIVLHGTTDPTTYLATGGVDEAVGTQSDTVWDVVTGGGTIAFCVFAAVAVFLVRGRVADRTEPTGSW